MLKPVAMKPRHQMSLCALIALTQFQTNACAAGLTGNSLTGEITVYGSRDTLLGNPVTATEGIILERQFDMRPVSRVGELMEFVPGLIATQHSGEGKANQYFLRGFNLDHGTDFAMSVDGLPVNMPSHGHGQGYADLNFLLPELTRAMLYRKGPYYAGVGDFGTAGSAEFVYHDYLPTAELNLTAGEHDYSRLFAGSSFSTGQGLLTAALAITGYAGPWQRDQNLEQANALLKYFEESANQRWSVTASLYDNTWDSTDQIPLRTVVGGSTDRLGVVDPTLGGDSHRYSLSFQSLRALDSGTLSLNAYWLDYQLDLYSNFTYFLDNPVTGDQFHQADDRRVYGLNLEYVAPFSLGAGQAELTTGIQLRHDDADVGLFKTRDRVQLSTIRNDEVGQTGMAAYASIDQRWNDWFRTVASLRADRFDARVDADIPVNSGDSDDTLVSPKLNLVFGPWYNSEFFLSAGRGFHSNDARGTTIEIDPVSGDPVDAVDPLVAAHSYEAGFRTAALRNTQVAVSLFRLELQSELVYVGDAGATDALGKSQRTGIEAGFVYAPTDWLVVDGDISYTRARFRDTGSANRIPLAVEQTASMGATFDGLDGFSASLRLRYLGEAPLIEDNSTRSDATFLANAEASYQLNRNWTVHLDVLNIFDSDDYDIAYYYESRLPGETDPIEDVHFHPVEPRAFRIGISGRF